MHLSRYLRTSLSPPSARRSLDDSTRRFLLLILLADLAFFALHLAQSPDGVFDEPRFRLDWDRGYAETFQYLKELWIVALLGYLALRDRSLLYAVFAGLFVYLGLDDSVRLHERVGGGILGARLPDIPTPGGVLSGYDWGQTLYALAVGLTFLLLVALLYRRSPSGNRRVARTLILLLAVLAGFGVATDILNALLPDGPWDPLLVFTEEAGEHLVMTAALGYLFIMSGRPGAESHA